jgi:hypothetical protein
MENVNQATSNLYIEKGAQLSWGAFFVSPVRIGVTPSLSKPVSVIM